MTRFFLKNRGIKTGESVQPRQIGAAALQLLRAFAVAPPECHCHYLGDLLHQRRAKFTTNRQRSTAHQQILQLTHLFMLNQVAQLEIAVSGVMPSLAHAALSPMSCRLIRAVTLRSALRMVPNTAACECNIWSGISLAEGLCEPGRHEWRPYSRYSDDDSEIRIDVAAWVLRRHPSPLNE